MFITKRINILINIFLIIIYIYIKEKKIKNLNNENFINFREIASFENNININQKVFDEFREINCNNKLIKSNVKFTKSINPDITVIITIYNQAHCIHRCLRSVQNQSLKNLEIIIIDDCSLDNSIEKIKNYQKEDERIILISHNINEGVIKSRTDGIRKSKGKYITIIDGDDALIHENILKHSLYIAKKAKLDVVEFKAGFFVNGTMQEIIYNYSKINISYIIHQPELRTKFFFKMHKKYFLQNRVIWSKLIKKELFIEVLNYLGNETIEDYNNYAEDTLMLVGIFHLAKSYYVMKEIGYYYSFKEKKNPFPKLKNRICKNNNKLKKMGFYKYLKFLVDKNIETEKEKLMTYNEFLLINNNKILEMKLDNRHFKLMFYVFDKLLEFDNLNINQKKYIEKLKYKLINRSRTIF